MTKSENKILDPERSHQIYLKIRDYSFSKLFEQMKKDDLLNGRLKAFDLHILDIQIF